MRACKRLVSLVTVILLGVTAGCGASAGGDLEESDGLTTVRIGGLASGLIATLPWGFADQGGFFEKHGVKADFVDFNGGPPLIAGVVSGEVHVGFGVVPAAVPVLRESPALKVVDSYSETNNLVLLVPTSKITNSMRSSFPENVRALKGLRFGVPALGGVGEQAARALIRAAGLSPSDVTFVATGTSPATQGGALKNDATDVQVSDPSTAFRLSAVGVETEVVANVFDTQGVDKVLEQALMAVDIVSSRFAEEHPDVLGDYCAAMKEGIEWAKDPANSEEAAAIVAEWLQLPQDVAAEAWSATLATTHAGLSREAWDSQPTWNIGEGSIPSYDDVVVTC